MSSVRIRSERRLPKRSAERAREDAEQAVPMFLGTTHQDEIIEAEVELLAGKRLIVRKEDQRRAEECGHNSQPAKCGVFGERPPGGDKGLQKRRAAGRWASGSSRSNQAVMDEMPKQSRGKPKIHSKSASSSVALRQQSDGTDDRTGGPSESAIISSRPRWVTRMSFT